MKKLLYIVLAGDYATLILFTLIGQLTHSTLDLRSPLVDLLLTGLPFLIVWLPAVLISKNWQLPASGWKTLGQALHIWLLMAPIALVIRALITGRASVIVSFMLATWGFGFLFIGSWRLLAWYLWIHRPTANKQNPGLG